MSQIKDIRLAPSGADKIAWVASYMPILNSVKEEFEKNKRDVIRLLGYDPFEYSEKYFKLGGYSNSIQCGLSDVFDESFVQLCQLTTFESGQCGFMFGDGGNLYFYIKKEDLRNREFGSTEIVLQCY